LVFISLTLLAPSVLAASTARADKLNYYNIAENHTTVIKNNDLVSTNTYTAQIPSGWRAHNTSTCNNNGSLFTCASITAGSTANFTLENPANNPDYTVTTVDVSGSTTNSVRFIKINPSEIFYTLVEFGRGRGNYPFNSANNTGVPYLPNATAIELNYLHKVFNIRSYFGLSSAAATNATWTCYYPNDTSIRQHLASNLSRAALWNVSYRIDEIGGSWERTGYFGQQILSTTYPTTTNITINCTNIDYRLEDAGGNISVSNNTFQLEFRNRNPFIVRATTTTTSVGNGTQEVEIVYRINNTEVYAVSEFAAEIQAPNFATFIGTRGELWGEGRDKYLFELNQVASNASESITLVARFNTSTAPAITSLNLTKGVKIQFIAPWEANAYNPTEYLQIIGPVSAGTVGTVTVNMDTAASIVNLQQRINDLYTTINTINSTVNIIQNVITYINSSIYSINQSTGGANLTLISTTVSSILNATNENATLILTKVRQLREFQEEVVFLITDSFGLQDAAKAQLAGGDREGALKSLEEANKKLKEAANKLEGLQAETTEAQEANSTGSNLYLILTLLPQLSHFSFSSLFLFPKSIYTIKI